MYAYYTNVVNAIIRTPYIIISRTARTEESLTLSTSHDFTICLFDNRDLYFDIILYSRVSATPNGLNFKWL